MPMSADDVKELRTLLAAAKKKPMSFGLCLGKKPEGAVLILHRTKSPDVLGRQAKQEGESIKVAFGMAEAQGRRLTLKCEGDAPTGIAKQLRAFLVLQKTAMKVIVADASGNVIEDDGEPEEEEQPEAEAQEDGPEDQPEQDADGPDDPLAAKWASASAAVAALVDRAVQANHPNAAKIRLSLASRSSPISSATKAGTGAPPFRERTACISKSGAT